MSTEETSKEKDTGKAERVNQLAQMVQRRVATIGLQKAAEQAGMDAEDVADFIFGTKDGKEPEINFFLDHLHELGLTLVPLDGKVHLDGRTLSDLIYGVLASLEATREELRDMFGRELVDALERAGINAADGSSIIGQIIASRSELDETRGKLDVAVAEGLAMKPAAGKSRATMIRIIGGLVQANYKFDIHSSRLDGIGAVLRDLETTGVSVDEGTLRDYLREAAQKIDGKAKAGNT
jgi:hypothetical protein